jgi:hypothetical protein
MTDQHRRKKRGHSGREMTFSKKPPKPSPQEKKITGTKGRTVGKGKHVMSSAHSKKEPSHPHTTARSHQSRHDGKIKDKPQPQVKSMFGKKPFNLQAKKPEADDRPRPARPPSTNKNMSATHSKRAKRLTGLML